MRVSRTRFSKRRSKRKTEFPIVAVVQKKRKAFFNNDSINTKQNISLSSTKLPVGDVKAQNQNKLSVKEITRAKLSKPQKKSRATIDYKNVILLRNLITAEGKILPRRINKLTAKQQRNVQKAIKSARIMGLIPFINKSRPFS